MTVLATEIIDQSALDVPVDHLLRRLLRSGRIVVGGTILSAIVIACVVALPAVLSRSSQFYFDNQNPLQARVNPSAETFRLWFGTDNLGRSVLARCLLGGTISLAIGIAAAVISVTLGVTVGLVAGYRGGWVDSVLMRLVDILYGLPYLLLVILLKVAFERTRAGGVVVLFLAIGLVSWLTMARVVRGQVLSLRSQPFIEAARAAGLGELRIFIHHLLPNLIGPISVYATLIIPQAILQEAVLSFLGVGVQPPLATWGSLASDGLLPALNPIESRWWLLLFPCLLLAITLLCLNFVGDGLRDVFDPKRDQSRL